MSVIVLLLTVALCAPIVAASTLPDPTWIGGFYDDADEDALLGLVWDQSPGLTPVVPPFATFESCVVMLAPSADSVTSRLVRPAASRAPPIR